jgi:biopolymer transport protein ExbD
MRKRGFLKREFLDESLINLTPLIDVIFVVLVAFILIAPFLEIDQVKLFKVKKSSEAISANKNSIDLYVREDNSIWLNKSLVKRENLEKVLKEMKIKFPNRDLFLFHDRKAYFGTYQMIKETAKSAGFERLDVILKNY